MSLHRLTSVTMGVPNVEETMAYYTDFGLTPVGDGTFRTEDGGNQLRVEFAPTRRLVELGIGADNPDDIAAIAARLDKVGVERSLDREYGGHILRVTEPIAGFAARIEVAPRVTQDRQPPTPYNGPGRVERHGRAPGIMRNYSIKPRKLGHAVVGTTNLQATVSFFTEGLGFQVSGPRPVS